MQLPAGPSLLVLVFLAPLAACGTRSDAAPGDVLENLGLALVEARSFPAPLQAVGRWAAFLVDEQAQDEDLDGDGRLASLVLHVFDGERVRNLGRACRLGEMWLTESHVFFREEREQGGVWSPQLVTYELETGLFHDTGIDAFSRKPPVGAKIGYLTDEQTRSEDLDGDGRLLPDPLFGVFDAVLGQETVFRLPYQEPDQPVDEPDLLPGDRVMAYQYNLYWFDESYTFRRDLLYGTLGTWPPQRLASNVYGKPLVAPDETWMLAAVLEDSLGDANDDGDLDDVVLFYVDVVAGRNRSTGLPAGGAVLAEEISPTAVWLTLSEYDGLGDVNGDGDTYDSIPYLYDVQSGELTYLGIPNLIGGFWPDGPLWTVDESWAGRDLDGDGDTLESFLFRYDPATGQLQNTGVPSYGGPGSRTGAFLSDRYFATTISEHQLGEDIDGDGELRFWMPMIHDFQTGEDVVVRRASSRVGRGPSGIWFPSPETWAGRDLNGDGDLLDSRFSTADLHSGKVVDSGVFFTDEVVEGGERLFVRVPEAQQGADLNGDGDLEDLVLHVSKRFL